MTQSQFASAPASSLFEASHTLFGKHPEDVLLSIKIGEETLDWLGALFDAIELLYEKNESHYNIKHLIDLGQHISSDFSNLLGCHVEEVENCLKAAGVLKGESV
jgi:hypothetical protein